MDVWRVMVQVQRRVQVLATFFKNKNPKFAERALSDAAYMRAVRTNLMVAE